MKKNRRGAIWGTAALAVGGLVAGALISAAIWPVINDVETGRTPEYPDLLEPCYQAEARRVFTELNASAESLENWSVTEVQESGGERVLRAEARVPIFGFIDDVTARVELYTEFVACVRIRSASRIGKGDFGQNARNIRALIAALDERLGAARVDPRAGAQATPIPSP